MIATLPAFDDYGGHNTVYGAHEIAPTQWATQGRDPIKILLEGDP